MTAVARRAGALVLMVLAGILLIKLAIGAVVGFVKMLAVLALVALFAAAIFTLSRR